MSQTCRSIIDTLSKNGRTFRSASINNSRKVISEYLNVTEEMIMDGYIVELPVNMGAISLSIDRSVNKPYIDYHSSGIDRYGMVFKPCDRLSRKASDINVSKLEISRHE